MLKTHLVRSSFLGQGLLLLLPNLGTVKGREHRDMPYERESARFRGRPAIADTLIVQPGDSSGYILAAQLSDAAAATAPAIHLNKQASQFVKSFMRREAESLLLIRNRSEAHFPLIDSVFTRYGLPPALRYLAVVESELRTNALSKAGAKGLWQLMPVTARELGLNVSKKHDERTHAYKSTVAAAKYLRSLYAEFGDWLLALAAYNGGPGTVYSAIKRSGSRNFWALQRYLPAESRGHVKRYIGVHYFFEGKGGVTTQTKAEAIAYQKKAAAFAALAAAKERVDTVTLVAVSQ